MRLSEMPLLRFMAADRTIETLDPAACGAEIAAHAAWLAARHPTGAAIGIALRSEPRLVLAWLATIAAGLRPLILQYPTAKQTRGYWRTSVTTTAALVDLAAVIGDERVASLLDGSGTPVVPPDSREPGEHAGVDTFPRFSILQLSSGTTGHRKAIAFSDEQLERHVGDYNRALALDPTRDHIVSWLPLYHDMGYIACFVMPLLLGVPVTTIDPEVWVADKPILFEAIERVRATHCYMPNFGFETLAQATAHDLSSMRRWISCAEPVLATTVRRFLAATGVDPATFSACYAMAENVFAVSLSDGLVEREVAGRASVSCGAPIPGVEVRTVDGELWLRSPASLASYVGGGDIRDDEGFYPTGDLGTVVDGEVHVTGRRRDLLIQAGKKVMLSAIDAAVGELLPETKGRAAAVVLRDERVGTEKPTVLIEATDFFRRGDAGTVAAAVQAATGVDFLDVRFVPPRFLTKTSSGKINRVESARHWAERDAGAARARDPAAELDRTFAALPKDVPVGEALDSLSLTLLRIIVADAGVPFRAGATLAEVRAELAQGSPAARPAERALRIVSLADRRAMRQVGEADLLDLSRRLGVPVSFEHLCLPPTPILLSDLVFHDHFRARLDDPGALDAVARQLDRLRAADLILIDDAAEMYFPQSQVYPVLSHRLERAADADLLAFRWQRYTERHHELPIAVVPGATLPVAQRGAVIAMLADYLRVPIFRVAETKAFASFTSDWEHRPLTSLSGGPGLRPLKPGALVDALTAYLAPRIAAGAIDIPPGGPQVTRFDLTDLAHFCSHGVDRAALDRMLDRFERFCIVGRPASVPYVRKRLSALGKDHVEAPSYHPDVLAQLPAFDCLLSCGATGPLERDAPSVAVMGAGWGTATRGIDGVSVDTFKAMLPRTGATDWFDPVGERPALADDAQQEFGRWKERAATARDARRETTPGEGSGLLDRATERKRTRRAARRAERRTGRRD